MLICVCISRLGLLFGNSFYFSRQGRDHCSCIVRCSVFLFLILGKANGVKRKDWDCRSVGIEIERKAQHLSLQVPLRSHSSSSSSEETSSSSAALPLLAGEKDSPSSTAEDHLGQKEFLSGAKREDGHGRLVLSVQVEL